MTSREKLMQLRKASLEKASSDENNENFTTEVIKTLENTEVIENIYDPNPTSSEPPASKEGYINMKVKGIRKNPKRVKMGFVVSDLACENVKKFATEYGYSSTNDFVNYIFEHLYDVM